MTSTIIRKLSLSEEPSVRFKVLTKILERQADSREVRHLQEAIRESPRVTQRLSLGSRYAGRPWLSTWRRKSHSATRTGLCMAVGSRPPARHKNHRRASSALCLSGRKCAVCLAHAWFGGRAHGRIGSATDAV